MNNTYFTRDFIKFFDELTENNNKEWFDNHRKVYEKEVKEPFNNFVDEMILQIQPFEPDVNIKPAQAITRINRDIRFTKDKRPYNTHVAAVISKFGKKDKSYPGLYIQLSAQKVVVIGGAYMLSNTQLKKVRDHIGNNLEQFQALYADKDFVHCYQTIKGEQHKRLPKAYKDISEREPFIANKQFFFSGELDAQSMVSETFVGEVMKYYRAGLALNQFLQAALKD